MVLKLAQRKPGREILCLSCIFYVISYFFFFFQISISFIKQEEKDDALWEHELESSHPMFMFMLV